MFSLPDEDRDVSFGDRGSDSLTTVVVDARAIVGPAAFILGEVGRSSIPSRWVLSQD